MRKIKDTLSAMIESHYVPRLFLFVRVDYVRG